MKTIENKKIAVAKESIIMDQGKIVSDTKSDSISYAELIDICIKVSPPGGLSYDAMKKISRVEPGVGKENRDVEVIELEDADFDFVKEKVKSMTWAFYHKEFVNFQEYIEQLK